MPKLSAMELLDLQDQLDELMGQQAGVSGLDLMDLVDQIDEVMAKMGFDPSAQAPEEVPPVPEPEPEVLPQDNVPEVVTKFLAGEYDTAESWQMISRLQVLEQFVPQFITLTQVTEGVQRWWDLTGQAEADANEGDA